MGATKEKLLRILDILKTTDEEHPITTSEIIDRLRKFRLEPERKSVQRDIQLLRDYGYDIVYADSNRDGFFLREREFDEWELKVLIDAVQSAKFLNQTDTDKLIDKLCSQASDDGKRTLRFMTVPADYKAGDNTTKYAIDYVLKAMRRHNKVHFDYVCTDDSGNTVPKHAGGTIPVSPYALVWRKDKYYLIGSYSMESGLSYYRLDRVRKMTVLEDERAVPLQDILGGDAENKLRRFIKQNVYNKKGRQILLHMSLCSNGRDTLTDSFGEDVRILRNPDGTLDAYVNVSDSEGLYTWLLHHGSEVSVIEPEHVRDEMRRRLEIMLENYSR